MKLLLLHLYQLIRYGAIQKPLPPYVKSPLVNLYACWLTGEILFGIYSRRSGELMLDTNYSFTEDEKAFFILKAGSTQVRRVVFPLDLSRRVKPMKENCTFQELAASEFEIFKQTYSKEESGA